MVPLRCLVPLVYLLVLSTASAQLPVPAPSPDRSRQADASTRAAKLAETYKAMLLANPVEGLALDRLWNSAAERAKTEALLEEFRALAAPADAKPGPILAYAHLLKRAGQTDQARALFERATLVDPTSPLPWLGLAEIAASRSQTDEAARDDETALSKLGPGDRRRPDILRRTGAAWLAAGQPEKAADAWEKLVASDPDNLDLHRELAGLYVKNGLADQARAHLQFVQTHADPAGRATAWRDLARLEESAGNLEGARDALERASALTSPDHWMHGELEAASIRLYQRAGRLPELEARWRAAAEAAPREADRYQRLADLSLSQGDLRAARGWLEKVVTLVPSSKESTLQLARLLAETGDKPRAAELYDRLLQAQPASADLLFARADLDVQLGQPEAAARRIEARVAANPADESLSTAALAFYLAHHLDAAAEQSLRADVARHPGSTESSAALAKFLFSERKPAEAINAVEALLHQPGDPATQATRQMQAADLYREQKLFGKALHCWDEAARLQPEDPAPLLAAADLQRSRGDKAGAVAKLTQAAQIQGPEQLATEHRLFEALADASSEDRAGAKEAKPTVWEEPSRVLPPGGSPLSKYIAELQQLAAVDPSEDHLLRASRWLSWAHEAEPALALARQVVNDHPTNLAARELMVSLAADLKRPELAAEQLSLLAEADGGHRDEYLRQLAKIRLQTGDSDEAIQILARLQQANPGSRENLINLADAQQQADHWYDALETWKRAYLAPGATPAQKEEVRRSLLTAFEHVGEYAQGFAMLGEAVDAQADLQRRMELFHQLASFAHRHGLSDKLLAEYQQRLSHQPDDYFLLTASAELLREGNDAPGAYVLAQRAFYSSPDPTRSLRELADLAETLGDDAAAVAYQRRLVAQPGQADATNLERLAALEEANLDETAASQTWESLAAKFPRDVGVLDQAATYCQRQGQLATARGYLEQAIAVDPGDPRRLLTAAELDLQLHDPAAARAQLETVLAKTTPEAPGEKLVPLTELTLPTGASAIYRYGGRSTFRTGDAGGDPSVESVGGEDRAVRLEAIEKLSRLLFPLTDLPPTALNEDQTRWIARWQAAQEAGVVNEPLAAWYSSRRAELAVGLLQRQLDRAPEDEQIFNAFVLAGLRLRAYVPLADWTWHGADPREAAERGHRLVGVLQAFLAANGKPGPGIVAQLFPGGVRAREVLWMAAENAFAGNRWYAEAAELGERVLAEAMSNRAGYGMAVAEWEVNAGNAARAKEALRTASEDPGANSFDPGNPAFAALRAYCLLLPPDPRAAYARERLRQTQANGDHSVHAILTAVLLHGLTGDLPAAKQDLDALLNARMLATEPEGDTPDARRWAYLLSNGQQLQSWGLDELAVHLWAHALEEAGGYGQQSAPLESTFSEMNLRLLTAQLATAADPWEAHGLVQNYLDQGPQSATVASAAVALWNTGQKEAAAKMYERLRLIDPQNTDYWPNLYTFYLENARSSDGIRLLRAMLSHDAPVPPGVSPSELARSLAALYRRQGDVVRAYQWLEQATQDEPGLSPAVVSLAAFYADAGRWDEAARTWQSRLASDPTHLAHLNFAAAEDRSGHWQEAAEVLRQSLDDAPTAASAEVATRLVRLLLAHGQTKEVSTFVQGLVQANRFDLLPALSAELVSGAQNDLAEKVLQQAIPREPQPLAKFHLQLALAKLPLAAKDPGVFAKRMQGLMNYARASPGGLRLYDDVYYPLARQQGADAWLERELLRRWEQGKGDPYAGGKLASLYLDTQREDPLVQVVSAIQHRPDLPEVMLGDLAEALTNHQQAGLAIPLWERLLKRFPAKDDYQLGFARALWNQGRSADAEQRLGNWSVAAAFREGVLQSVAHFYAERGAWEQAAHVWSQMVDNDPECVQTPKAWLELARVEVRKGQLPAAKRLLQKAYAKPASEDLQPLMEFLVANGELAPGRVATMPAADFPLTFERRAQLLERTYLYLDKAGRQDEAMRLAGEHPPYVAASSSLIDHLCQGATRSNMDAVLACLEQALQAGGTETAYLQRSLAGLYKQQADRLSQADPETAQITRCLARAFELAPDDFSLMNRLYLCYSREGEEHRARDTIASFVWLSLTSDTAERTDYQMATR